MSKNHFLPFQINTIIFIFVIVFTKWLPAAILDVQNSLSMAFLAISDQYETFFSEYFTKWPSAPILDVRNSRLNAFLDISDRYATLFCLNFCDKMTAVDHISSHFRSIRNFKKILNFIFLEIFIQNGRRRPLWISEIHFRSHFWPFQIDTQLYFF